MGSRSRRARGGRGQGMTEYIIVVALIAVAAIGVVTVFGDNIRALFGASTAALAGEANAQVDTRGAAAGARGQKTLRDFSRNNSGYE